MLVYTGKKFVPLSKILEQPEVLELRRDLLLEYRSHRLELVKRFRSKFVDVISYPPLVSAQASDTKTLCQKMCERNHHRKDFRSVYPPDYYYKNLSFDWD